LAITGVVFIELAFLSNTLEWWRLLPGNEIRPLLMLLRFVMIFNPPNLMAMLYPLLLLQAGIALILIGATK